MVETFWQDKFFPKGEDGVRRPRSENKEWREMREKLASVRKMKEEERIASKTSAADKPSAFSDLTAGFSDGQDFDDKHRADYLQSIFIKMQRDGWEITNVPAGELVSFLREHLKGYPITMRVASQKGDVIEKELWDGDNMYDIINNVVSNADFVVGGVIHIELIGKNGENMKLMKTPVDYPPSYMISDDVLEDHLEAKMVFYEKHFSIEKRNELKTLRNQLLLRKVNQKLLNKIAGDFGVSADGLTLTMIDQEIDRLTTVIDQKAGQLKKIRQSSKMYFFANLPVSESEDNE